MLMPAERDLNALLATVQPSLAEERFVFLTGVDDSLEAIGFLAVITTELANRGISMNAVSAFYHDHLFVAVDKAEEALSILQGLSAQAQRSLTA